MHISCVLDAIRLNMQQLTSDGKQLNERYLHHSVTHHFQTHCGPLDLSRYRDGYLHPEWPTSKKGTGQHYGRYRNVNGHYMPHREGKAGFIDLAIGPYLQPSGAVEFSLKYGWCHEEIAYDFLKLMDPANPFLTSISFNVILRDKLVTLGLADLEAHMNRAYREAIGRLGGRMCADSRQLYFVISEISRSSRRHWMLDRSAGSFIQIDAYQLRPM